MDRNDLARADALNRESMALAQQLRVARDDAKIVEMTLQIGGTSEPDGSVLGETAQIDTSQISHPPQMLAAIRAQIQERKSEIDKELAALGVTVPAAQAARVAAKTKPPTRRK